MELIRRIDHDIGNEVIEILDSDHDEAQLPPWQDPYDSQEELPLASLRDLRPSAPFTGPFEVIENTVKWKKINVDPCKGIFTGRFEIGEAGNIHLQCLMLADGPADSRGKYYGVSRCSAKIFIENFYADLGPDYNRIPDKTWLGTCESKPCDKGAWIRQLEYCTTMVEKSGDIGNGHFEYGPKSSRELESKTYNLDLIFSCVNLEFIHIC